MSKLSAQDRELLNTDFGEEMEKEAAARVAACQEAYAYGCEKLAADAADEMDKKEEEEDKKEDDKEEKMDEESEKAAAELGAFIERGFFDGLRKLGSERHNDETYYLAPYIQEKIAAGLGETAKKTWAAIARSPKAVYQDIKHGIKGIRVGRAAGLSDAATDVHVQERAGKMIDLGKERLKSGLIGASPYAAVGGAGIYGAGKLIGGKKAPAQQQ